MIQSIVAEINVKTGESECRYYKERLLYLEESQRDLLIDSSRILSCHGELKNNRGAVSVIVHNLTDRLSTCPLMACVLMRLQSFMLVVRCASGRWIQI